MNQRVEHASKRAVRLLQQPMMRATGLRSTTAITTVTAANTPMTLGSHCSETTTCAAINATTARASPSRKRNTCVQKRQRFEVLMLSMNSFSACSSVSSSSMSSNAPSPSSSYS